MITFLITVGMALLIGAYWLYRQHQHRKKTRAELAAAWGQPKEKKSNWAQIRYYFELFKSHEKRFYIDDNTWDDLNLNAVFKLIDRTESNIGQQVLYDLLRRPADAVNILENREQWIQLFTTQSNLRLDVQMELQKLKGFSVWRLSNLLFEDLPHVPRWSYFLLAVPVLMIVFILFGIFLSPVFWLAVAGLFIINIGIRYLTGRYIARYTAGMSALSPFLEVCEKIGEIDLSHANALRSFGESFRREYDQIKSLRSKVGKVLEKADPNDASAMLLEYINILFLARTNMFTLSVRSIKKHQQALQKLYHHVGYIDALIAAASFKEQVSRLCRPTFHSHKNELHYQNMIHPLLEEPVPNSAQIGKKGILVTGSNMAGKSTFLKALGVNQILAQTFYFCCADGADLIFCRVISSMRREDQIIEGKSFYLTEVERVKTLIDHAKGHDAHHLFLLDEIFRGTNTIERVSASLEVLRWLNKPENFVLASTHDLELVDLLEQEYEFHHFSEEVQDQTLSFDYKLKAGPSSSRNAIKLLDINGYPPEIVTGAINVAEMLENEGMINFRRGKMGNS